MNHPDDPALPADPGSIDLLIDAAAPEQAQAWRDLREQYQLTFHPVTDRKGVTMRARRKRIEFDQKTMTWLWLLGFAGWRAFRLHGPHLLWREMTGATVDPQLRADDPTYEEAEANYEAVLYAVREFPDLEVVDAHGFWPDGIPRPQADKQGLDVEQQAAFDLTMIATAYMLLHEVRHVMFNVDGGRPPAPDEEFCCDTFARRFLLEGVDDYAGRCGQPSQEVTAKRAAGIALGTYALYEFTSEAGRGGAPDYPPVADRLDLLFPDVNIPPSHWFWNFAASILTAIIVRRDRMAVMPNLAGRALCHALIQVLRARHEV